MTRKTDKLKLRLASFEIIKYLMEEDELLRDLIIGYLTEYMEKP